METRDNGVLAIARMDASGRLRIPRALRRALTVTPETDLAVVRVGDALVIAPCDAAFTAVTGQLEARLAASGSDLADLLAAAEAARREIARDEFAGAAAE